MAVDGVSAFPQAVTGEMLRNFAGGGAAIAEALQALSPGHVIETSIDDGVFYDSTEQYHVYCQLSVTFSPPLT